MPSKPITATLGKARLVVPEGVRKRARFKAGDEVEFRGTPGVITIIAKLPVADKYTPEQRRIIDAGLDIADAQVKVGLTFGPFNKSEASLDAIIKAEKHTQPVTIEVSTVLLDYFEKEAKRLGLTAKELIVTILETHRFADRDQQLITRAISKSTDKFKTGRYES